MMLIHIVPRILVSRNNAEIRYVKGSMSVLDPQNITILTCRPSTLTRTLYWIIIMLRVLNLRSPLYHLTLFRNMFPPNWISSCLTGSRHVTGTSCCCDVTGWGLRGGSPCHWRVVDGSFMTDVARLWATWLVATRHVCSLSHYLESSGSILIPSPASLLHLHRIFK